MSYSERRTSPRQNIRRSCKVLHEPTGRYIGGHTRDLSPGGTLLELETTRPLRPGDSLALFIAWNEDVLLYNDDAMRAEVKHVLPMFNGRQLVGLEFAQALSLSNPAIAA